MKCPPGQVKDKLPLIVNKKLFVILSTIALFAMSTHYMSV